MTDTKPSYDELADALRTVRHLPGAEAVAEILARVEIADGTFLRLSACLPARYLVGLEDADPDSRFDTFDARYENLRELVASKTATGSVPERPDSTTPGYYRMAVVMEHRRADLTGLHISLVAAPAGIVRALNENGAMTDEMYRVTEIVHLVTGRRLVRTGPDLRDIAGHGPVHALR